MKTQFPLVKVLVSILIVSATPLALAASAQKSDGQVVAKGKHFEISVAPEVTAKVLTESKIQKYRVQIVSQSAKHKTQRSKKTLAVVNSDLTDAKNWRVQDFDGDGFDDFAYLRGVDPRGCHSWQIELWQEGSSRFLSSQSKQFAETKDGKKLKSCVDLVLR